MPYQDYIPADLIERYEVHEVHHAAAILAQEFPEHFDDIVAALREFRLTRADITKPGGNESDIPKKLSRILRPRGWVERRLEAKLMVDGVTQQTDTHFIDYVKGRVALDMEWNSKDQTFDRDLYAFRAFFEFKQISLGVLVTRSNDLNEVFRELGVMPKYGASTTHIGKLLPRLQANRNGGCPVLVFGIRQVQEESV